MAHLSNIFFLAVVLASSQGRVQKTEVNFRGESFNVTSGCPSKNPEVLRNICDALCYVSYSKVLKQCPDGPDEEAQPFPLVKHTKVPKPSKVVLEYLQSGYLVKTGCDTRDVRVKRFYGLCLAEYGEETVCRKDRIPGERKFSNKVRKICFLKETKNTLLSTNADSYLLAIGIVNQTVNRTFLSFPNILMRDTDDLSEKP